MSKSTDRAADVFVAVCLVGSMVTVVALMAALAVLAWKAVL